jgi:biotin carboxylase
MADNFSGKRLLIAGAGIFQIPAIQKARDMGITVITVDKNPESPGFRLADHYEVVSTGDTPGLLKVARKYKIDGIMTLSTEVAVVPVAYVAEKLGLPSISVETAKKATRKYLMKEAFKIHGVPCPAFHMADNPEDLRKAVGILNFPLMVKPSEGYASKSVFKVNTSGELEKAFYMAKNESPDNLVIIEEFIQGQDVSGESFTTDGFTEIIYITNKKITQPPHYIPLRHSLPCRLSADVQDKIKETVRKGIKALGVKNGPVNFDIKVTGKGPLVLEMGARLGGNCLPMIVEIHSGIDTIRESITLALGGRPLLKERFRRPAGVRLLTSKVSGKIVNIAGIEELRGKKDVLEIKLLPGIGDRINRFSSGIDKIGYLIVRGEDTNDIDQIMESYAKKIKITVSQKDRLQEIQDDFENN